MKTEATNEQVGQSFYLDMSSQIDNLKLMTVVKVAVAIAAASNGYGLRTDFRIQPKNTRAKSIDGIPYKCIRTTTTTIR